MIGDSTKRLAKRLAGPNSPILQNAIRLLEDAQLLRKAQRYPSCAALAVLSLEELGKFAVEHNGLIEWISPRYEQGQRRLGHKQKQMLAAEALIWTLPFDEVRGFANATGNTTIIVSKEKSTGPSMLEIISSVDDKAYARNIAKKSRRLRDRNRSLIELAAGKQDNIKQKSLYVDRDELGVLGEPKQAIDRLKADTLLNQSSAAIHATVAMLRRLSKTKSKGTQ
jgi:AbiV family abortive infection protein